MKVKESWEIEGPVGLAPAERGPTELRECECEGRHALYPGEERLGIKLGLPTNWLDPQADVAVERNKKISEDNLIKLADFYQTNNRYPSRNITIS